MHYFEGGDQPEVTSQEKSDPIITLVFIGVWDIPDQPEFFCFVRNMARLASPYMNYRQEGPMANQPEVEGVNHQVSSKLLAFFIGFGIFFSIHFPLVN